MAHAEWRGGFWRARWTAPDGSRPSKGGFETKKAALEHARDQEASIRAGTYDPSPKGAAGLITLTEWVNIWYPAQDLEMSTLESYRYLIETHLLPKFGHRALKSLTAEEIGAWHGEILKAGYKPRTARDARSMLVTVLADAVPKHIEVNPAARKRGKGRKGLRRVARQQQARKAWSSPLQALLLAERCAALSGRDDEFVMVIETAWTGSRWSEVVGLPRSCVHASRIDLDWKLYELTGRFYFGPPKDGSIRQVDLPPFLGALLADHIATSARKCRCRGTEDPWCQGAEYVFLGPDHGHPRRSSYARRLFRPAADGWYPLQRGRKARPAMPVLVTDCDIFPGRPVTPWPAAVPGEEFVLPAGRGHLRLLSDERTGRCGTCRRAWPRRLDGAMISHLKPDRKTRCPGSGGLPAEDAAAASWLPLLADLTAHGLRHGHQTWLDEDGLPDPLKAERMGHEEQGMRGVYGHVTEAMRSEVKDALQVRWENALRERFAICPQSGVAVLNRLLAPLREQGSAARPHLAPRIGHRKAIDNGHDRHAGR